MKLEVTWPFGKDTPWCCWIELKTPRNEILENNKIYSLNVSFMTFVKHMEWKLTTTPLHEEKQPRVMLLRYAHWNHTFLNPPYEFLKHFTTHKLIHLTWLTNFLHQLLQFNKHMAALNATAIKAFRQNSDSTITTTWITKHWRIWNISHN